MTSVLGQAALGKRKTEELLRLKSYTHAVNVISRLFKIWLYRDKIKGYTDAFGSLVYKAIGGWLTAPTPIELLGILHKAADKAFGSPMSLSRDQLKLRQYTEQYYNPGSVPLSIESMGLPDPVTGQTIKIVVPGGLISIPHGYCRGGKHSTVAGIAPQLKPCPKANQDGLLDLSPQTYVEWIIYNPLESSRCCQDQLLWSDTLQLLVCQKCKGRVKLYE